MDAEGTIARTTLLPVEPIRSIAQVGEQGLISEIVDVLAPRTDEERRAAADRVVLGPGDDAAVLTAEDGSVVVSTDMLVQGQHFRLDWSSAQDVGHKAAAQNLADIAAMGAVPTGLLVALAAPADTDVAWLAGLAEGLRAEAATVGCFVVGGDTVAGDQIVVAVTAVGSLRGRPPLTRAGAAVGDTVAVCGRLGWAAGGLAVLSRGFRSPRVLADAHRRPSPPYAAGPAAAEAGATSLVDVSDGLLSEARHLGEASGVRIDVWESALQPDEELVAVARAIGVSAQEWVLSGGEDHALLGTFPGESPLPAGWRRVGAVLDGAGVSLDGRDVTGTGGFRHFVDGHG